MNISLIIPTYNEEQFIRSTLREVQKRALHPENIEIIVVDGGSEDQTVEMAKEESVNVIEASQTRRSIQMNEGARAASHDMLYFLHADTQPPRHFDQHIIDSYRRGYPVGCFRLSFNSNSRLLAFYGWCTRFNVDAFRFGDQSLFVHRCAYESVYGYNNNHYLMEGHELVLRLKKDYPFAVENKKVTTSARKYNAHGTLRLQLIYMVIVLLNKAGFARATLRNFYQKWVQ